MGRKKTVEELRADLARVFFDRMSARKWYGFEEAQATLREIDAGPQVIDECFGGSLKGGLYKNDLRTAVASAIEGADKIIAALREQPEAALELLTEPNPEVPR